MTIEPVEVVFGRLVRDGRIGRGLGQEQLAKKMRIAGFDWSQSTATRTETASRPVPLQEAVALAAFLGIKLGELIPNIPTCPTCGDAPPAGFTCNECGETG